jgi:imidazolonepropionase-like amidohydrolase
LTPLDVIRAATVNGAKILGRDRELGTISAGKLANFVVLKADPLMDVHNLRTVEIVIKHGKEFPRSSYVPAAADLVPADTSP